jgi:hypothetical protein
MAGPRWAVTKHFRLSYSIAKAALIADQLERLSTQHPHQLAGQLSNLAFWMAEAAAAIAVIDDYPARFRRLHDAQVAWVRERNSRVSFYCPICEGECEFSPQTPAAPRRTPSEELDVARRRVKQGATRLLLRLYGARFIRESELRQYSDSLELPIEPEDLQQSE